jgi:small subunit ribosomal protein S12
MITYAQRSRQRVTRKKKLKTPALARCPQKKAQVRRAVLKSPKKPHSAKRRAAQVQLMSTGRITYAYIPGIGHSLKKFDQVLIRGGRRRDIPNMKCQVIRGKLSATTVAGRRKGRSKYGMKRIKPALLE